MNRTLLWLIVAVLLILSFVVFRTRSGRHLNISPDAEREIEKAKRR